MTTRPSYGIPGKLNVAIAIVAMIACVFCLAAANRAVGTVWILLPMIGFGLFGNTVFSLLHEATHSTFSRKRWINSTFGVLTAAFFPTGFSFQRRCHLNHHRNNRTEFERFETYSEKDSRLARTLVLYGVLTGVYWILPPLSSLAFMISPRLLIRPNLTQLGESANLSRVGSASMLRGFEKVSPAEIRKMRWEILFSILFQAALFSFLDLRFSAWILCYATFGVLWSSLQYTDHAYSVHDIRDGAWNLKVNPVMKAFFLNYHDHLAHHQNPHVSWKHLPKIADATGPRVGFWPIYLRMWKGPIRMRKLEPIVLDPELEALIESDQFV